MITVRSAPPEAIAALRSGGVHPVLARVFAARGVREHDELAQQLERLLPPAGLLGMDRAARALADAIDARAPILVVADYDCDGATACAVAVRGLRAMGAVVDYLVPNRLVHGYGLTPTIVDLALAHPRLGKPALVVTVDNGIASVEGVAHAARMGVEVVVTDHHLPGPELPQALAIVDPNQPGCAFASKNLAGVGVMFYVLLGLRAELRARGRFAGGREPALGELLDLVALGTVADLVRLDRNNRLLVAAGLKRIRAGRCVAGIAALFDVAGRDLRRATSADLGFAIGPRINAAGRLADISEGIECLLCDDREHARALAAELDAINRERRSRETSMRDEAIADAGAPDPDRRSLVVHRESWHEGIVGLVASRLKDLHHRPVVAFAPAASDPGLLRGSGRSIAALHLRDAIDLVGKRNPGLIERFGGHAMAAGLTMRADGLERFAQAFEQAVRELGDPAGFERELLTDGALAPEEIDLALCEAIGAEVWGSGFAEPLFADRFQIESQRLVKDRHMRLTLRAGSRRLAAIAFGRTEPIPANARLVYRLARDDYGGTASVQLQIEAVVEQDAPL